MSAPRLRPRPRRRALVSVLLGPGLLGAGLLLGGCAASEPGGTLIEDQGAPEPDVRPPETHATPPLGRPRPKLIPGDVLRREAVEEAREG